MHKITKNTQIWMSGKTRNDLYGEYPFLAYKSWIVPRSSILQFWKAHVDLDSKV